MITQTDSLPVRERVAQPRTHLMLTGNLTSATSPTGVTSYLWDGRNRLRSISSSSQTITFTYDFRGDLIFQSDTSSNLTKNYVLDDLSNVAYIGQSSGDNLSILAGRKTDQHLAVIHSSGQVEYGLTDALNSTAQTVDQTGKALQTFFYEPFGQTTTLSTYPFQFAGRIPVTSSLYYCRARYYEPVLGRFISEDPIGFRGGLNLYAYVSNNPTTRQTLLVLES